MEKQKRKSWKYKIENKKKNSHCFPYNVIWRKIKEKGGSKKKEKLIIPTLIFPWNRIYNELNLKKMGRKLNSEL